MTVNRIHYSTITGSSIATNSLLLASTLTGSSIVLSGNVLNSGTSNLTVGTQSTGLLVLNSQGGALALQSGGVTYASVDANGLTGNIRNGLSDLTLGYISSGWITLETRNQDGQPYPTAQYGNQSCSFGWNGGSLGGEYDFMNNYGNTSGNAGGFAFYNRTSNTTKSLLASINSDGINGLILSRATTSISVGVNNGYGTGGYNVVYGSQNGNANFTGNSNVMLGYNTGQSFTSASGNTLVGIATGNLITTGISNTLVGYAIGNAITTGFNNIVVGYGSGTRMTTCEGNVIMGKDAGVNITTGRWNVAIGERALAIVGSLGTGDYNVAVGHYTFPQLTTGTLNVGVGAFAGTNVTTGTYNAYIGYNAVASGGNVNDEIVIGASATGAGSNTITLGNSSNTKTIFTAGNVGIGTNDPKTQFQVWTGGSLSGLLQASNAYPSSTLASFVSPLAYASTGRYDIEIGSAHTGVGNLTNTYKWLMGVNYAGNASALGGNFEITSVQVNASEYAGADTRTARFVINTSGSIGIGTTDPNNGWTTSIVQKTGEYGILNCITNAASGNVSVISVYCAGTALSSGWASTQTVLYIGKDNTSNRSINAAGTVNVSGADYAEYMIKNGTFAVNKGDIVGIDITGKITNQYDNAISFVIKSTNPSYVGGDVWSTEDIVGKRPEKPDENATEEEQAAYEQALATFNAAVEVERAKVDRIAFAGQVPVNVQGAVPGQYIVAIRNQDGTIGGQSMSVSSMTFATYDQSVGKVINILPDGRANVIVKVA